jgi:hypothetical protein
MTAGEPLAILTDELPAASVGAPYEASVAAGGGTEVGYVWRLRSGALPDGVELVWQNRCVSWGRFQAAGAVDGRLPAPRLRAVSAMAASRQNPGILWMVDDADSGLPEVFALTQAGAHRQTYRLETTPIDWEGLSLGPGPTAGKDYIYVGDFGDNSLSRSLAWLLRFEEPGVPNATEAVRAVSFEVLYFKYPDGRRDVETLFFDWLTGTPYLVERNGAGCKVYKFPLPLDPERGPDDPAELLLVTPRAVLPATLTGGDASRDGQRVVLRNYTAAFEYARPANGTFDSIFFTSPCALSGAGSQQYEAITYSADGTRIYTTTERAGQPTAPILAAAATRAAEPALLRGRPAASGDFQLTLEVSDSSGAVARRSLILRVRPLDPGGGQVPGDCDQNGPLDISDGICLLGLLFGTDNAFPPCGEAAGGARESEDGTMTLLDFNGDARLDISDPIALLMYLFLGGSEHVLGQECRIVAGCQGACSP